MFFNFADFLMIPVSLLSYRVNISSLVDKDPFRHICGVIPFLLFPSLLCFFLAWLLGNFDWERMAVLAKHNFRSPFFFPFFIPFFLFAPDGLRMIFPLLPRPAHIRLDRYLYDFFCLPFPFLFRFYTCTFGLPLSGWIFPRVFLLLIFFLLAFWSSLRPTRLSHIQTWCPGEAPYLLYIPFDSCYSPTWMHSLWTYFTSPRYLGQTI